MSEPNVKVKIFSGAPAVVEEAINGWWRSPEGAIYGLANQTIGMAPKDDRITVMYTLARRASPAGIAVPQMRVAGDIVN